MCGVFGIRAPERDVSRVTFFGLFALQHRGQESAGIAVSDRGRLTVLRDMGLVAQVFDEQNLSGLQGEVAIGHTRYSTTGSTQWTNAQPIVDLAEGTLLGFRDPHGFRPLNLGRIDGDPVLASETCALDLVGATHEREVAPGELVSIDEDGVTATQAVPQAGAGALCLFEFIYLARPDSTLAGIEVHAARVKMGERLAEESPVDADLVMPAPDSGTPAAIGFSRASGIPFSEGLIKNRYVGRTFIEPDQGLREQGIRLKFNPLSEVAGKRVVLVDDSIVRGNTMRQIVMLLFDAGAQEVHVRISSPPIVSQCYYGIDFADEDELIAASRSVEEVRE